MNPYKKKLNVSFDLTALFNREEVDKSINSKQRVGGDVPSEVAALANKAMEDGDVELFIEILLKDSIRTDLKPFFEEYTGSTGVLTCKVSPIKFEIKE